MLHSSTTTWSRSAAVILGVAALLTCNKVAAHSGARELEGRLIAPCCWTQTLDIHDSPIATELRLEIGRRLTSGEAPGAIEDDFARRYGEKIRAVPRGEDPRVGIPVIIGCLMGFGALLLLWFGLRWRRGSLLASSAGAAPDAELQYDTKLDAELKRESE